MSVAQPGTPVWIEYDRLMPAPYNPNVMSAEELEKERRSIRDLGFIQPIVTRDGPRDGYFWIVDGEHRRDIGHDLGMDVFPCWNLGTVPDDTAKQMTLVLNGLHGTPDPTRLREVLDDLLRGHEADDLIALLPFGEDEFHRLVASIPAPAPMADIEPRVGPPSDIPEEWAQRESWVERVFRLPREAARVLDEAIAKVREEDPDMADWQALEAIAADFMGH
jgi:hypothetical protein